MQGEEKRREGMKKTFKLLSIVVCLAVGVSALAAAAEFQADVLESRDVEVRTGHIWVKDGVYRLELEQPSGPDLYTLVGAKPGKTQVVLPKYKVYLELASDNMMSLMKDPFQAAEHSAKQYEIKDEGRETLQHLACDRQLIHYKGTGIMRRWVSPELGFPVKIEQLAREDYYTLLKNIEPTRIPAAQFEVPAGFSLKTEKEISQLIEADPSVAAKAAAYRKNRPTKSELVALLGENDTWNLVVRPGTKIRVEVTTHGDADKWFCVPYKDQTVLKPRAQCTYAGAKRLKFYPDSGADGISMGAVQGEISVRVALIGQRPHVRAIEKVDYKAKMQGSNWSVHRSYRTYQVRISALSKPAAGVRFRAAGKKHELKIPAGEQRDFFFSPQDQLSTLDIMVDYGKVQVISFEDHRSRAVPHILLEALASKAGGPVPEAAPQATAAPVKTETPSTGVQPQPVAARTSSPAKTENARMVLILDASGSMWGRIDGKPKIEIAKTVLDGLIDALPGNFQTGLMAYGHHRKGDCKDIEMVVPVGPHNAKAMKAKIQAISPKGKTPLGASVMQAAKALRYTEERATVVLISDGLETCDMDPCELAAELAKTGVDFTVHVIGFDITKEEQEQLRCLADKTGGLFLAAANAAQLRDALFEAVKEAKEPPRPVVENPGTAVLKGPDSAPVGSAFTVQWKGPDSRGDLIAVRKKGYHGTRCEDYAYTKRGNPAHLTAPGVVGDYELRYIYGKGGKVLGKTDLKVTPIPANVQAPSEAPVAAEFDVSWKGPDYPGDYIAIAKPGTTPNNRIYYTYTSKGSPLKLMAPSEPGPYEVRYILGKSRAQLTKTVIDIKAASASVQAPAFTNAAAEFEVTWQGPDNPGDYIAIAKAGTGPNSRIHYTRTKEGSPLRLRAPSDPGTYEVRYILRRGRKLLASSTIEIKAVGASLQAPASAAMASQVEVAWQGPNNNYDYISFVRPGDGADQRLKYTYTKKGSPLQVLAPSDPGKYEVIYLMADGKKVLARTPIEIKPVSATVNPPATAAVNSKIEVPWQGPGYESDVITIARPDQNPGSRVAYRYTRRGNPAILKAPDKPGTYEVRYILGQGRKILDKKTMTIK
jgi:Ca-activated chloride channel homolog